MGVPTPKVPHLDGQFRTRLAELADRSGVVPFDRFVELALYDPEFGYYTRTGRTLGREGDFYTAAHASPLFGATIARRILQEFDRLGRPPSFTVVEVGAGDGTLAADLLAALTETPAAGGIDYVAVERSASLRARLRARLEAAGIASDRIGVASSVAGRGPLRGVVLANELLDALPFRRLVVRDGMFHELGVRVEGNQLRWAEGTLARPLPPPALPDGLADGTVLEVSPLAEAFVREVGDHLVEGAFLLLDYGDEEAPLIARHPGGTLTAYRSHRRVDDPLAAAGTADLSAYVNFRRIRGAAARSGFTEVAFGPQVEALGRWGFADAQDAATRRAASDEERVRLTLGAKNLLFGFESFRVLELVVGRPPSA